MNDVGFQQQDGRGGGAGVFCLPPTDQLVAKIRRREWETARKRLLQYPWDAAYGSAASSNNNNDNNSLNNGSSNKRVGTTALHVACMYRAPLSFLQRLIEAFPPALWLQDEEGWTPLHVQLVYGNCLETTVYLIRRGGSAAMCLPGKWIGSPLHLACRHGSSTPILTALLQTGPSHLVCTPNESGCYPANLLWKSTLKKVAAVNTTPQLTAEPQPSWKAVMDLPANVALELLEQMLILLKASHDAGLANHHQDHHQDSKVSSTNDENTPTSPLLLHHVMIFQGHYASDTDLLHLYLRFHPEAITTVDPATGRLPLHVAAAQAWNRPTTTTTTPPNFAAWILQQQRQRLGLGLGLAASSESPSSKDEKGDPLFLFLDAHPGAAMAVNHDGQVPLHEALANQNKAGFRRQQQRAQLKQQQGRHWGTGIEALVQAAPQTLTWRCPKTNLLPFQLAAAATAVEVDLNGSERGSIDNDPMNDDDGEGTTHAQVINTVWELLRSSPHALFADFHNSSTLQQ